MFKQTLKKEGFVGKLLITLLFVKNCMAYGHAVGQNNTFALMTFFILEVIDLLSCFYCSVDFYSVSRVSPC